jgi:hypothetical protein
MMWDNTRPMKGINPIHVMNECSFTVLLVARRQQSRAQAPLMPLLFPTATLEGL